MLSCSRGGGELGRHSPEQQVGEDPLRAIAGFAVEAGSEEDLSDRSIEPDFVG